MLTSVHALLCIAVCSASELASNEAVILSPDGSYGYRVMALSQSLLRIERSNDNASDFEDRPSYLAVNRSWGGVQGGITKDKFTVSTKFYSVKFAFKKSAQSLTKKNSSTFVQDHADAVCKTKCVDFRTQPPLTVASSKDCSNHCDRDTKCNYWVFGGSSINCYLLSAVVGDRSAHDRTFGGVAPVPSITPTPTPEPTNQDSITLFDASGKQIWEGTLQKISYTPKLPAPSDVPSAWALRDHPRFIPPAWGATPKPADTPPLGPLEATNGYDMRYEQLYWI
jgi:hypothetical protein